MTGEAAHRGGEGQQAEAAGGGDAHGRVVCHIAAHAGMCRHAAVARLLQGLHALRWDALHGLPHRHACTCRHMTPSCLLQKPHEPFFLLHN